MRQSDLLSVITVNINQVGMAALAFLSLGVTAVVVDVQLAVAVRISPSITALAAVTGAVLTVIVWPLVRRSRRLGEQLVESHRGVLGSVTGFLDGLQLAKVHGLEAGHVTSFDEAIRRTRSSQIDFSKVSSAASAVQLVVTAIVLAVLVGVAIEQLRMPLAELLVLAFVFTRIVPQVTSAQQDIQRAAQGLPAFDEVIAVIESCEGAEERLSPGPVLHRIEIGDGVRLDDVSFAYPVGGEVLKEVSLDLPARRTTALVGPSGAGKSTLASLAVGLLAPTSGTVTVGGTSSRSARPCRLCTDG